jgi:hypothetical protein
MVNRAMARPGAIDDSDPISMRRAVELARVRSQEQLAELV